MKGMLMEIFLVTLTFFIIVTLGTICSVGLHSLINKIKTKTKEINNLEQELYTALREIQFSSKNFSKTINKLTNQQKKIIAYILEKLVIAALPFKKIKKILLIYTLGKKFL